MQNAANKKKSTELAGFRQAVVEHHLVTYFKLGEGGGLPTHP